MRISDGVVIGIVGRAGAGKSALGRTFEDSGFISFAVGDTIKRLANRLFGIPESVLWCDSQDKTEASRNCMEKIGKAMRDIDPLVWCRMMKR